MRFFILAAMMAALLALPAASFASFGDPDDPGGEIEFYHLKCSSRITATGALQVITRCPGGASAANFAQGFDTMRTGGPDGSFPRCDQPNDVIRLTFPVAKRLTTRSSQPLRTDAGS